MGMLSLKRQKWTGLLPVILLWLLPGNAAAQNSYQPVSKEEAQCVVSVTKDALQNNPQVRQQLDQMLSQVRAQSCQSGEQMAQQQFIMMMQSLTASMYDPVIRKCFLSGLQQHPNPQAVWQERQSIIFQTLPYLMQEVLYRTVPRPLCR